MENKLKELAAQLVQKVERVRKPDSLVLPYFSDLHASSADDEVAVVLADALKLIADGVHPTAVIDLGDNLSMLGRDAHITNDDLKKTLTAVFDKIKDAAGCPLLLINGNHDAVGTDFFKPELWREVANGKYDDGLANYHTTGAYYHVDFNDAKTRLVFLSLPYDSDLEAEHPTPLWGFGKEQIRWLGEVALNTEYDVILFTHVPLTYKYLGKNDTMMEVWNGQATAISYIKDLCGRIEDFDDALATIKKNEKIRFCFSGHIHTEALWMPGEQRDDGRNKNHLSCPQYTIRRPVSEPSEERCGIMISVVVWTPSEGKMHILQLGDGEDRTFDVK